MGVMALDVLADVFREFAIERDLLDDINVLLRYLPNGLGEFGGFEQLFDALSQCYNAGNGR